MRMPSPVPLIKASLLAWCLVVMSGCGGGQPSASQDKAEVIAASNGSDAGADFSTSPSFQPTSSEPPSEQTIALQKEGARLNSEELAQIAKTGVLPKAFEGQLLSGAEQKAATERTAAYRFFNTKTSAHFYTTSTAERDNVQATLPFMSFEGPAFYAAGTAVPGLSPVHRFYNTQTGVHFYTISEAERASVVANLPQFTYEGIAYYASTLPGTGYTPLYRFFYSAKGFHFYTNSLSERDTIIATLPQYSYEGVGYHVLGSDWQAPAIPHSGVTSDQCYQAGSDTLVPCTSAGALALNPQQDGHRAAINPMSYGGVPGHKPLDSCVLDQVTGLIWEVKAASGLRSGANTYTNLGNGAATDSSGYVAAINAMQLCGFNDWRIPTLGELMGLVDFGTAGARIRTTTFPNTSANYWSSDASANAIGDAWAVSFAPGLFITRHLLTSTDRSVRLVRGSAWTGPRYVIGSVGYSGDNENNVVIDRQTGLTWRRCEEGRSWNGNTCAGDANTYTQPTALAHATGQNGGWRLPNARELASLVDLTVADSALNAAAFPGGGTYGRLWSSTPWVNSSSAVFVLATSIGNMGSLIGYIRGQQATVLLVK